MLLDVAGVGVLTRFWATGRAGAGTGDPAIDFTVIDRVALAIEIDGRRVLGGARGVPLGDLRVGLGGDVLDLFVLPALAGLRLTAGVSGCHPSVPLRLRRPQVRRVGHNLPRGYD